MKSIFITLMLASMTANAGAPIDLFHCDANSKESDSKKFMFSFNNKSKATKKAEKTTQKDDLSDFVNKEVMPSLALTSIKRNAPIVIDGSPEGFNIQLDLSAVLNFSKDISYKLAENPAAKDVGFADKNSQIVLQAKVYQSTNPNLSPELRAADEINDSILKQIAAQTGTTAPAANSPKISVEVTFSELNSATQKFMRVQLKNLDDQALVGVELKGVTGSISVIKLNGVTAMVYTFHANLGLMTTVNAKVASQIYDPYAFDISGIQIAGKKSQDPATVQKIKALGTKVCSNFHFHLESSSNNLVQSIIPISKH